MAETQRKESDGGFKNSSWREWKVGDLIQHPSGNIVVGISPGDYGIIKDVYVDVFTRHFANIHWLKSGDNYSNLFYLYTCGVKKLNK